MTAATKVRREIFILSPATRFGSWHWLERVIVASSGRANWTVVSYGRPERVPSNARFICLPKVDYGRLSKLMARRGYIALNLMYYIPLVPLAWIVALLKRPKVLVGNGVVACVVLWPIAFITGAPLFLAYHGYAGHVSCVWRGCLHLFLPRLSGAFVNSTSSRDDLARFMGGDRIHQVPHWVSTRFLETTLDHNHGGPLRLLYVGRLDTEKFTQCLRVGTELAREGRIEFWVVGGGPLDRDLRDRPGVKWFGYVESEERMSEIYSEADLVWAPADTTYVSLPGVEGLASGCPLVVGDIPAVDQRAIMGIRVPGDLIPASVGYVVDGEDDAEALSVLRELARTGVPDAMRIAARAYASERHGPSVVARVLAVLEGGTPARRHPA